MICSTQYKGMTTQHESVIERWMLDVSRDGGIARFDHLHIDRIDDAWASREHWIEGGLAAFHTARSLRDLHRLDVKVELAFSLQAGSSATGVDFATQEDLANTLDWTPPALYLFEPGHDHAIEIKSAIRDRHVYDNSAVEELLVNLFGGRESGCRCLYMEFRRTDEPEYSRSVLLQG
jgi:hypothetical protein